ncbi:Glutathione gamma-glutamylcysteinyltransferase [Porphyridium purpureum]|uniref:glutathione gamma-glutamylcysteinyltransferase n=1 Tax=Porphyridium purpureum TaxID=35688 RepID=A0A5J4YNS2_PORPP|nr:Glutathione gamma-glutamylcysteinyltransferase [Porphyridium purpureum]|eukprot:POR8437..scf295_9
MQSGNAAYFSVLISAGNAIQSLPAFCALSSLVQVLNALEVDPGRVWKGPWRWWDETFLDCCLPLSVVEQNGITLPEFICVAQCQGLRVQAYQPEADTPGKRISAAGVIGLSEFRAIIVRTCTATKPRQSGFLVVSYSRKTLGQTGDGHFSPLGAYHAPTDTVLILDTARFKYSPHWVSVALLYEAMIPHDSATDGPRGLVHLMPPGHGLVGSGGSFAMVRNLPLTFLERKTEASNEALSETIRQFARGMRAEQEQAQIKVLGDEGKFSEAWLHGMAERIITWELHAHIRIGLFLDRTDFVAVVSDEPRKCCRIICKLPRIEGEQRQVIDAIGRLSPEHHLSTRMLADLLLSKYSVEFLNDCSPRDLIALRSCVTVVLLGVQLFIELGDADPSNSALSPPHHAHSALERRALLSDLALLNSNPVAQANFPESHQWMALLPSAETRREVVRVAHQFNTLSED